MTLRHLEIFLAVFDWGNMRRAAESLYISQPTVSGAVKEIEEEYGVLLFERLNHRLHVTREGELLASYARRLLALFREMDGTLKSHGEHASLRIGATLTIGTCVLPDILQVMKQEPSAPEPVVLVDNTRAIEERIARGELDVGFVEGVIQHPDLTALPVMDDPLIAVTAAPSPGPMTLKDLCAHFPLLMREPGSGTRAMVENLLQGVPYRQAWVCSNTQAIIRAAEAGLGVTILSRLLAADSLQAGRLWEIPLTDCSLNRSFRLVWHKDKFMSPGLLAFCRLCREYADKKGKANASPQVES